MSPINLRTSKEPPRSFEEDARPYGPLTPRPLALRSIPLDRIVGSVGRAGTLSADFRSLHRHMTSLRYRQLYRAMAAGEALPPIELYKLGPRYYILDGHHRVVAAHALGQVEIDALVTEHLPAGDAQGNRVFLERLTFERATALLAIDAARAGTYPRLAVCVEDYAQGRDVDLCRAAQRWYRDEYLPAARRLERSKLIERFPREQPADLFVRVWERRAAEEAAQRRPISLDEALSSLANPGRRQPVATAWSRERGYRLSPTHSRL